MSVFPPESEVPTIDNRAPVIMADPSAPTEPMLRFFVYSHLPAQLAAVSMQFSVLADYIVATLPRCAERTVALRKLLEAKDAGVRSVIP